MLRRTALVAASVMTACLGCSPDSAAEAGTPSNSAATTSTAPSASPTPNARLTSGGGRIALDCHGRLGISGIYDYTSGPAKPKRAPSSADAVLRRYLRAAVARFHTVDREYFRHANYEMRSISEGRIDFVGARPDRSIFSIVVLGQDSETGELANSHRRTVLGHS